jgi:hypothetical protein
LAGREHDEIAARIDAEPLLRAEFEQLGAIQGLVREGLTRRAAEVPVARFEQIWAEIDRAIESDARARRSAPKPPTAWERAREAWKTAWVPTMAAAAAAVLAVVLVQGRDDENEAGAVASVEPPVETQPRTTRVAELAQAQAIEPRAETRPPTDTLTFPEPRATEAEIHGVEFGGRNGRIERTGTVTVLYVEEELEPPTTERSL